MEHTYRSTIIKLKSPVLDEDLLFDLIVFSINHYSSQDQILILAP